MGLADVVSVPRGEKGTEQTTFGPARYLRKTVVSRIIMDLAPVFAFEGVLGVD